MVVPRLMVRVVLAAVTPLLLGAAPASAGPAAADPGMVPVPTQPAAPGCRPAQVLDLTEWKITLPIPKPDNAKSPIEITQPELASFTHPTFFRPTPSCDAVVFRAPVNGTTTSGSKYPRSELREMTDGGKNRAAWSSGAGVHRMTVTEAFTHLPVGKPELVGAQIHDVADDIMMFRLEGSNLWITNGDNPHHKLITDKYVLGTKFDAGYEVSGAKVRAYYNGVLQTEVSSRFRGAYFKAGAYTQSNCNTAARCAADNYGETTIYKVTVFHQVSTWETVLDWIITFGWIVVLAVLALIAGYLLVRRFLARRRDARVSS